MGTRQSDAPKHLLASLRELADPSVLQPVRVPQAPEGEDVPERDDRSDGPAACARPSTHMLFRPEEPDGLSREAQVVPPVAGRQGEVDDVAVVCDAVGGHADVEALPTVVTP